MKHAKSNWNHCHNDIVVNHISDRGHVPSAQGTDPLDIINNTLGSLLRIMEVTLWISFNFQTLVINAVDYNLHSSFWSLKFIFFQTQCIHFFQFLTKFLYKCCSSGLLQFIPLVNFKAIIWTLHSTPTVETCFQLGFFNRFIHYFCFPVNYF